MDTTGVTETINPVRLSQEFQGRVANPRDVFVFHRAKQSRGAKVVMEKPELSIDNPDLTIEEKLAKVRMHTLVQEYLGAQQVQVLAEPGMSDALEIFMNKDDIRSFEKQVCMHVMSISLLTIIISSHYHNTLKAMRKGVQVDIPDDEIPEDDNIDELVSSHLCFVAVFNGNKYAQIEKMREKMEKDQIKKQEGGRTTEKVRLTEHARGAYQTKLCTIG